MISYSTNFMGPISLNWYRERELLMPPLTRWSEFLKKEISIEEIKQEYRGGRIDIAGTESVFGEDLALPIMHIEDWNRFSHWLDSYKTKTVKTLDEILESYYNDGNNEIRWWKDKKQ